MPFVKGQSGNPRGRPRRTDTAAAMRAKIAEAAPGIVDRLIELAGSGDLVASRLLLDRVLPTLKPVATPVAVPMDEILADLARMEAVQVARAAGRELEPRDIESATARLKNMTRAERDADLAALEAAMERRGIKFTPA